MNLYGLQLLGQEDCLYLNVFTPSFIDGKLPVVVNIPGGGFVFGGAAYYGPARFMNRQDFVLVTFNYRLGPQGFLNFAESSDNDTFLPRGNMGLKDQRLVFQWIQKNIAKFGGDPNRVTIYGQSAGGISANFLMLSNTTNKLFHRVITHSGAAISGWSFARYPKRLANNLVKKLGCSVENKRELMDCLISADPHEMASFSICPVNPTADQDIFIPSIETVITEDTFFSEHPYELLKKGVSPNIPFMLGVNSGDGALRTGRFDRRPEYIQIMDENWDERLTGMIGLHDLPKNVAQEVRRFYFPPGNKTFVDDPQFFKDGLVQLVSDACVFEPASTVAKEHSRKNGSAPTYMFIYDYLPTRAPGIYSLYRAVDPEDWLLAEVNIGWTIVTDWINEHVFGRLGGHRYRAVHAEDMFTLWELHPIAGVLGVITHAKEDVEFTQAFINVIVDFARGK